MREFAIRTDPVQTDAPIDVVRAVLTEVDKYGEWNPFTLRVRTDFTIGSAAHLPVRMGRRRSEQPKTYAHSTGIINAT